MWPPFYVKVKIFAVKSKKDPGNGSFLGENE